MDTQQTGLDILRQRSIVDCDTMDEEGQWSEYNPLNELKQAKYIDWSPVATSFRPFHKCISNQVF